MAGYVDIHSHVLPGVDDGSPSIEVSLAMLEVAIGQGVGAMVLTPHLSPFDGPEKEEAHCGRFAELQEAVRDARLKVDLHLGVGDRLLFQYVRSRSMPLGHLADTA